ncbi:hypothetical protein COL4_13440 [Helicobacter pylori]
MARKANKDRQSQQRQAKPTKTGKALNRLILKLKKKFSYENYSFQTVKNRALPLLIFGEIMKIKRGVVYERNEV